MPQGQDAHHLSPPPVIVDLGKPNVWTMDQAHYLLERNRALDLGIQESPLDKLDPNSINGIRVDVLRSLISASVAYNGADRASNRVATANYNRQTSQYNEMSKQRDRVFEQMLRDDDDVTREQERLDRLGATADTSGSAYKLQQARLTQLKDRKAGDQTKYDELTKEMGTQPQAQTLTATAATDAAGTNSVLGSDQTFTDLLKTYATGTNTTKLAAQLQLDNHINLQYEMVAKQLTLLRDQAGPDNKVLFLELPQSIYYTDKLRLYPYLGAWWGTHVVQSWYRLDEALTAAGERSTQRPASRTELREMLPVALQNRNFLPTPNCKALFIFFEPSVDLSTTCPASEPPKVGEQGAKPGENPAAQQSAKAGEQTESDQKKRNLSIARQLFTFSASSSKSPNSVFEDLTRTGVETKSAEQKAGDSDCKEAKGDTAVTKMKKWSKCWDYGVVLSPLGRANRVDPNYQISAGSRLESFSSPPAEQPMYALDLIPRQSTLNVADANVTSRSMGFSGLFKFLSGFGATTRYERQRDQFGQFIQEETYASAFGKGAHEFGWTFGALPGTNRLAPGLRTTYAIVVVPKNARIIRLYGMGCGMRRRRVPDNPFAAKYDEESYGYAKQHTLHDESCSQMSTFDLEVPATEDTFGSESPRMECRSVTSGQRTTITLFGRFNEQTGMLINGTPLAKVTSMTQPTLVPATYDVPAAAGDVTIKGSFEYVNEEKMVASFIMPSFSGNPDITLITAGGTQTFPVRCEAPGNVVANGQQPTADQQTPALFTEPLGIDELRVVKKDNENLQLTILGQGFPSDAKNGTLFVGKTKIDLDAAEPPKHDGDTKFYQRKDATMLVAIVPRDKTSADTTVDYIVRENGRTTRVSKSFPDTLPPVVDTFACTYTAAEKKGGAFNCKATGNYFSDAASPVVAKADKGHLSIDPSSARTSRTEWHVVLQSTDGTGGNVTFGADGLPQKVVESAPEKSATKKITRRKARATHPATPKK